MCSGRRRNNSRKRIGGGEEMYARQRAYFDKRNRGPAGQKSATATAGNAVEPPADAVAKRSGRRVATGDRPGRSSASNSRCAIVDGDGRAPPSSLDSCGSSADRPTRQRCWAFLALAGLVIHAIGFEPPEIVSSRLVVDLGAVRAAEYRGSHVERLRVNLFSMLVSVPPTTAYFRIWLSTLDSQFLLLSCTPHWNT